MMRVNSSKTVVLFGKTHGSLTGAEASSAFLAAPSLFLRSLSLIYFFFSSSASTFYKVVFPPVSFSSYFSKKSLNLSTAAFFGRLSPSCSSSPSWNKGFMISGFGSLFS